MVLLYDSSLFRLGPSSTLVYDFPYSSSERVPLWHCSIAPLFMNSGPVPPQGYSMAPLYINSVNPVPPQGYSMAPLYIRFQMFISDLYSSQTLQNALHHREITLAMAIYQNKTFRATKLKYYSVKQSVFNSSLILQIYNQDLYIK